MNFRLSFALIAMVAVTLLTVPATAQEQFTFTDFSSTTGLTLHGTPAAPVTGSVTINNGSANPPMGTVLQLTPATGGYATSVWYSAPNTPTGEIPILNGFTTNFQFQFTHPSSPPADGIAFVIQNVGTSALGDTGGAIGYSWLSSPTQSNAFPSLAVEFDTFYNSEFSDPFATNNSGAAHIGVQSCGGSTANTSNHGQVSCNLGMASWFSTPSAFGTQGTFDGTTVVTLPGTPLSEGQLGQELYFLSGGVYDLGSLGSTNTAFFVDNPNHVGAFNNSTPYVVAPFLTTATPNFDDGKTHNVTINYVVPSNCAGACASPTLSVIVDGISVLTTNVNIPSLLNLDPSGDVWVGFTAGTGADFEEHDLVSWNFSSSAVQGTTLPPTPVTPSSPVVTATFNSATNNLVQHVLDFSASTVTIQPDTQMINSNQAIAPADWPKYVASSPYATTSCIPHAGESGNCKLYIDLCTNSANPTPAGVNCPQSTADNIVIQDNFDAVTKPTTPPGTGFGFLEGGDNWSTQGQSSCLFGGPLSGTSCPQDILVSFSGDASSTTGRTPSLNSTFVTVSGVLLPNTFPSVSPTNSYGWTNTQTPTLSFASYPPGVDAPMFGTAIPTVSGLPQNGYIAAPIASIAYNINGAAIPPSPILNPAPCFGSPTTPGGPVPLSTAVEFAPAPVPLALNPGSNTIQYSATDCAGISELVFTFNVPTQTWSTETKSMPVYVDNVNPAPNCPSADTLWHNGNVTVNCPATDNASGFAPPTSTVGATSFGPLSLNVPLSTSVGGTPVEVTNAFTGSTVISDLAGNTATAGPVGPFKIDTKAPLIIAVTPAQGSTQNYFFNQAANTTYKCSDGGSGVAKCGTASYSPATLGTTSNVVNSVNTAVLGQGQNFSVSATDAVGNSDSSSLFTYNVSYLFIGFLTLQQPPLMNTFKAGKAMSILFDVQDGKIKAVSGLKLAPAGAVTVSAYSSTNCQGVSPAPVAFNPTLVGLPFGAYSLNWTPPSTLAGKCVTVSVGLGDGLTHRVNLKF